MAEETSIPYQSLINLYLRDCVAQHRKIDLAWIKTLDLALTHPMKEMIYTSALLEVYPAPDKHG